MSQQPATGTPANTETAETQPPAGGGVRRHHTISASSRTARAGAREAISEETPAGEEQPWNDDEVVDQDWVGGVGAVGEKTSSLHRQSSLPTRYHRVVQGQSSRQAGNSTPKTLNSLSAIAGHEGDEEDWEREIKGLRDEGVQPIQPAEILQVKDSHAQASNQSPLSTHFNGAVPSPPPAASGVRRHQSLTYGAAGARHQVGSSGLKRSGTHQGQMKHSNVSRANHTPSPPNAEENYDYSEEQQYEDESYYSGKSPVTQQQSQGQYPTSPMGRSSPWATPGAAGGEWRSTGGSNVSNTNNNSTIDDVQRALSAMELASNNNQLYQTTGNNQFTGGQSAHPPRFNPNHPPPVLQPGMRTPTGQNGNNGKLQLMTNFDGRKTPVSQQGNQPSSATSYIPQTGQQQQQQQQQQYGRQPVGNNRDGPQSVSGNSWDQKQRVLGSRNSNPNLQYGYAQGQQQGRPGDAGIPNLPPMPTQYMGQSQASGSQRGLPGNYAQGQGQQGGLPAANQGPGFINTPIDVPSLIAAKGYNPANFDFRPSFARFFVIKSYTEDDVHKSLKYEIWSSTDPGNKRLDKAFQECAGRGPIYLFFSVNASGHFCGMAEMLTPVDYTRSSTVWASDKWKGVFKVRWIFVRDIPNANLRHIRLNNTQERKPVTNSRDTQELLPEAGQEMLKIFHTHPARTSLLQDFAFYELQAMQKMQVGGSTTPGQASSPPVHSPQLSPVNVPQQNSFAMNNYSAQPLQMPQMTPMMQMQMQMNMNPQFGAPQTQAMHQSVMRHPSPGPPMNNQGYNMGGSSGQRF